MSRELTPAERLAQSYGAGLSGKRLRTLTRWFERHLAANNRMVDESAAAAILERLRARDEAERGHFTMATYRHFRRRVPDDEAARSIADLQPRGLEVTLNGRAREVRPATRATVRAGRRSTRGETRAGSSDEGSDEPPPLDLGRLAAAGVRLAAHLQRRQRRRFEHSRESVAA